MASRTIENPSAFLLGHPDSPIWGVGTFAADYMATAHVHIPNEEIGSGNKLMVRTRREFEQWVNTYDIRRSRMYPGSSTANCLNQISTIARGEFPIHAFTTLAVDDPTTDSLLQSLEKKFIIPHITPFSSTDPNNPASNPEALLVRDGKQTKILSYKDHRMPAIEVETTGLVRPGVIISGAAAGDGVQTIYNMLDAAKQTNSPIAVLGTSSEIRDLRENNRLRDAYNKKMSEANFFAGNVDEATGLLLAMDRTAEPAEDGAVLVQQLRTLFHNDELNFLLTMGPEGSIVVVGETIYREKETPLGPDKFKSTAGAGDAKAGAFIAGVHMKGMDPNGILWTLPRSTVAAHSTMRYVNARTGHLSKSKFLAEPPKFEITVTTFPRWV